MLRLVSVYVFLIILSLCIQLLQRIFTNSVCWSYLFIEYLCLTYLMIITFFQQMSTYAIRDSDEYMNFCDRSRDQRPQPEEVIGVSSIMFQIELMFEHEK